MSKRKKIRKPRNRRKGKLSDGLAELSRTDRDEPEAEPLRISYKYYNDNLCECNILQMGYLRGAFRALRNTGRCFVPYQLKDQSIKTKKIRDNGSYHRLWAKQPPDVDI